MKKKIIFIVFGLVLAMLMQSCFLFQVNEEEEPKQEVGRRKPRPKQNQKKRTKSSKPTKETFSVGDKVGNKIIVWKNENPGAWMFLAMGPASEPMQWANTDSTYINASGFSNGMGMGKENTLYLLSKFDSNAHSVRNNAAKYSRKKGGWLPSRKEAEKIAEFTNKKFWMSYSERTSKAFFYDSEMEMIGTAFRTEKKSIVTIPIYYLDENARIVNPD